MTPASIRVRRRWPLVALLGATQLACLLAGLFLFGGWLSGQLVRTLHAQVLETNEQMARQMARLIPVIHADDGDLARLQELVEQIELPNEGFLCIVAADDGRLLCHPELRRRPEMANMPVGGAVLHGDGVGAATILESVARGRGEASGRAEMPDGTHIIGASAVPEAGVVVLAHQRDRGVQAAIDTVRVPVRRGGLITVVAIVVVMATVNLLIMRRYESRLAEVNADLEQIVARRTEALTKTRDAVIFGLAKLAESRDDDTGEHLDRIRAYTLRLAREIARNRGDLSESDAETIALTSSLHDIGKVGVPDAVLLKPGRLTPEEFEVIKTHTTIGGDCLLAIKQRLGEDDFLTTACEIALSHHEKWDGSGYPHGLAGEAIPLSGRIVALADVYDALTSKRVYKDAMSHDEAVAIILEGRGAHFDPQVVDAFIACATEFAAISDRAVRPIREAA